MGRRVRTVRLVRGSDYHSVNPAEERIPRINDLRGAAALRYMKAFHSQGGDGRFG